MLYISWSLFIAYTKYLENNTHYDVDQMSDTWPWHLLMTLYWNTITDKWKNKQATLRLE